MPEMTELGPFNVGILPVPHSIPEASGLVIDTPAGRVVHSGDLKLDADPQVGEGYDEGFFRDVAGQGLLALVCDSTNVMDERAGRSEASIVDDIDAYFAETRGMIVATTFASNIARLRTLANAAARSGRAVMLLGQAMNRMIGFAQDNSRKRSSCCQYYQ